MKDPGADFLHEKPCRGNYMVDFRLYVSDPKSGRAYNVDASGAAAGAIVGKHMAMNSNAGSIGLEDTIKITGACKRRDDCKVGLPGARNLLLAGGVGFHPKMDGERREAPHSYK